MDIVKRLRNRTETFLGFLVEVDPCEAANEIERLREALQAVVDAYGTGQSIGAQGAGGWLDQARKALKEKE